MKNLLSVLILFTVVQAFSQAGFSESYKKSDSTLYATKYQLDTAKQAMRSEMGGGSNFANADLTFTANRTHNGNGNSLTLNNMSSLSLGYGSTGPGDFRWLEDSDNGSNYISLKAPSSLAVNLIWTLPNANPSDGFKVLGSSSTPTTLEWKTVPNITNANTNRIPVFTSSTNLDGLSGFTASGNVMGGGTFNASTLLISQGNAANTTSNRNGLTIATANSSGDIGLGASMTFRLTAGILPLTDAGMIQTTVTNSNGISKMSFKCGNFFSSITDWLVLNEGSRIRFPTYTGSSTGTFHRYLFTESDGDVIQSSTLPLVVDKTITAGGTTGNQTINKYAGSVNFAAAATSLTVTNSLVTTSSVIICTIATNDATMTSVQAVAASGSFVIYANAAATAETRVNFIVLN